MTFEEEIKNQDRAFYLIMQRLREVHGEYYYMKKYNKGRHLLLYSTDPLPRYYVVYKREWFNTFAKQFPAFIQENPRFASEVGESINTQDLENAVSVGTNYLIFVHEEGIWKISALLFLKFARKNNLVRRQNRTNPYKQQGGFSSYIHEDTYSIPASMLEKW